MMCGFLVSPNPAIVPIHNSTDTKDASSEKHIEVEHRLEICRACNLLKVDSRQKKFWQFFSVTVQTSCLYNEQTSRQILFFFDTHHLDNHYYEYITHKTVVILIFVLWLPQFTCTPYTAIYIGVKNM